MCCCASLSKKFSSFLDDWKCFGIVLNNSDAKCNVEKGFPLNLPVVRTGASVVAESSPAQKPKSVNDKRTKLMTFGLEAIGPTNRVQINKQGYTLSHARTHKHTHTLPPTVSKFRLSCVSSSSRRFFLLFVGSMVRKRVVVLPFRGIFFFF